MPRFYFDCSSGGKEPVRDNLGQIFESIIEAQVHAMGKLPAVGIEPPLREGEFRTWTAVVRDESGDLVCRYIMAIVADQIGPAVDRVLRPADLGDPDLSSNVTNRTEESG